MCFVQQPQWKRQEICWPSVTCCLFLNCLLRACLALPSAVLVPKLGHTMNELHLHLTLSSEYMSVLSNVYPVHWRMLLTACLLCEIPVLFLSLSASPNHLTSFSWRVHNTLTSWASLIPEDSLTLRLYPVGLQSMTHVVSDEVLAFESLLSSPVESAQAFAAML